VSRIGKLPVKIPAGVTVSINDSKVEVKGPKGALSMTHNDRVVVVKDGAAILVKRHNDDKFSKASHGLYQRLIQNMVIGVTAGYKKELEVVGVGYRFQIEGKDLVIAAGLSHQPRYPIPAGIKMTCEKPTSVTIEGADKQLVGQVAAEIRKIRPPEPYLGKGIRYAGEHIRRKVGKAGAK